MEKVCRCDMFSKYFLLVIGKDWFSSISGNNSRHFHENNNKQLCCMYLNKFTAKVADETTFVNLRS